MYEPNVSGEEISQSAPKLCLRIYENASLFSGF